MTTSKKTAKEISDIFIAALEAQLSQTIPLFPKAFNRILAKMLGLVFVVLYQFSEFIGLQMLATTMSDKPLTVGGIEFIPLDEEGKKIGLTRGTGQRSTGIATVTVLTQTGSILSGAKLLDSETGQLYLVVGDVALDAAEVAIVVRAVNYSSLATLYVGQVLSFVSAPATIEKDTTVYAVTLVGDDPESTEDWRARILAWWAARPHGGAYADYREWGTEVDGVENIYPFSGGTTAIPTSGPGQVDIYVEASDTTDGIADAALLAAVKANIEKTAASGLADRRPMNTYVNVASIYRSAFDFTVSGINVPGDLSEAQTSITAALSNYMLSRENYIDGLSLLPRRDNVMESEAAGVVGRVVAAIGGTVQSVTIDGGTPIYTLTEGQKAKLGSVTFS